MNCQEVVVVGECRLSQRTVNERLENLATLSLSPDPSPRGTETYPGDPRDLLCSDFKIIAGG